MSTDLEESESNELVSVIVPYHDDVHYLAEAIESVLSQNYAPLELVLIEDRSSDGSTDVALAARSNAVRITNASSRRSVGPAGARNAGLLIASGEIISYLDADDRMADGRITRFVDRLRSLPANAVLIGDDELFLEPGTTIPPTLAWRFEGHRKPYTMSMTHRASLLGVVGGFDERFRLGEDLDWIARAKALGCPVVMTNELATHRRIHGKNISYEAPKTSIMRSLAGIRGRERAGQGHCVSFETGTAEGTTDSS
jgi:glycosyltransferase involved in cell wall biosynthesis